MPSRFVFVISAGKFPACSPSISNSTLLTCFYPKIIKVDQSDQLCPTCAERFTDRFRRDIFQSRRRARTAIRHYGPACRRKPGWKTDGLISNSRSPSAAGRMCHLRRKLSTQTHFQWSDQFFVQLSMHMSISILYLYNILYMQSTRS